MITISTPKIEIGSRRSIISLSELHQRIGAVRAVAINFVPAMLYALVFDHALCLCDVARSQRLADLKKPCRLIRATVADIGARMTRSMSPEAAESYNYLVRVFDTETTTDQWLLLTNLTTEAANHGCPSPEASARMAAITMISAEIDTFRYDMMNDYLPYCKREFLLGLRRAACSIIRVIDALPSAHRFTPSSQLSLAASVLRNRAWFLAEKCLADAHPSEDYDTTMVRVRPESDDFFSIY